MNGMMPLGASLIIPFETGKSRKPRSLLDDVQQIVKQKGGFRNVNEGNLLTSITRPDVPADDSLSNHSSDTEVETVQETQRRLFSARNELSKLYQTSLNEINTLQDLVSWLLSTRSKVAVTTMSPALKQGVPVGSADLKIVPAPEITSNAQQKLSDISNIVRLQAFEKCSDKLLAASNRLDSEAKSQSKYWDQMAAIRSRGWPVSRLPRDGRTLVAHVASTEAAPRYRNKGLIAFRRDNDGDLTIADLQAVEKERHLAVYVRHAGKITGFYRFPDAPSNGNSPLETALARAKKTIFQEELFIEASREAQLIANMNVKVRSTSIEVDITSNVSLSITYLPDAKRLVPQSHEDDHLAAFAAKNLSMMLIAEHEHKHRARSQNIPAPMLPNVRSSPEYVLIRPVIAQLRHAVQSLPVLEELRTYQKSLETAGSKISLEINHDGVGEVAVANLQSLRQTTTTGVRITLPSGLVLELNIDTQLAPPRFGTQFRSSEYMLDSEPFSLQPTSCSRTATAFVASVIAMDVCLFILNTGHGNAKWELLARNPLELVLKRGNESVAILATSCHSGTLAVSCRQLSRGDVQKAVFDKTKAVLMFKDGQYRGTEDLLVTLIDDWTTSALSLGT